ncbi:hypothetical protein PAXINDRAFT_10110 [Paxillus involutus ATCC 200175]|nr:hypothetical protein PAXINDRAFT_10110 [Paxillus involutus ATCC 200175]
MPWMRTHVALFGFSHHDVGSETSPTLSNATSDALDGTYESLCARCSSWDFTYITLRPALSSASPTLLVSRASSGTLPFQFVFQSVCIYMASSTFQTFTDLDLPRSAESPKFF